MSTYEKTCDKFYCIYMLMYVLINSEDNEQKKLWLKKMRDRGHITNEEAVDLYVRYED